MINKEAFIQIMKGIQEYRKRLDKISDFLEDNIIDSYAIMNPSIITCIVDALQKDLNCENEFGGEISWWLYEFEDGEKRIIEFENGEERDVTELEDFYNYLIENYNVFTSGFIQPVGTVLELPNETTTNATEYKTLEEILEQFK